MKLKQWQNIFDLIVNASSIVQHAIQIKNRIMKHTKVSVKIILNAKKNIAGILSHVFVRILSF